MENIAGSKKVNGRKRKRRVNWALVRRYKLLYLLLLLPITELLIFNYLPMGGVLVAFHKFKPSQNLFKSMFMGNYVGFKYFSFVKDPNFWGLFKNTFLLGFYSLLFGFPAPIVFALLLNEIRSKFFKRSVQTITYLPYFISSVAVCGMILGVLSLNTGIVNNVLAALGFKRIYFMTDTRYFRAIYVISGIWQGLGFGSIIYLASIAGIDPELYEAATIDGANRLQKMYYITLQMLKPTISILLILGLPGILSVNFEKVLLLYNQMLYPVADVIPTYVYRMGVISGQTELATAVGLFNSLLAFILVFAANTVARRMQNAASFW